MKKKKKEKMLRKEGSEFGVFLTWQVDIYESRPFIGGKVASFQDKQGNHIEMGLHVFFGCYNNLFRLMGKVGEAGESGEG